MQVHLNEKAIREGLADDALAAYQFGEGVTVVEQDNWNTDDPNDFTKIVYVSFDGDDADADSHKISFHVRFNQDGCIEDAYGLDMKSGNDIGWRGDNPAEPGELLTFEVTGAGFNAETDETDDRVFWVKARSAGEVEAAIRGTVAGFHRAIVCESDIDFRLPGDLPKLREQLAQFVRKAAKEFGATEYYVWCDGSCDNKTVDPVEAVRWAAEFRTEGREDVYIVDVDNKVIDEVELGQLASLVGLDLIDDDGQLGRVNSVKIDAITGLYLAKVGADDHAVIAKMMIGVTQNQTGHRYARAADCAVITQLSDADETRALALRTQALALLQQAEAIDGLKPYLLLHVFTVGSAGYVAWHDQKPTQQQAATLLDELFEPELGEWIAVEDNITLEELAGVALSSRIAEQESALDAENS